MLWLLRPEPTLQVARDCEGDGQKTGSPDQPALGPGNDHVNEARALVQVARLRRRPVTHSYERYIDSSKKFT